MILFKDKNDSTVLSAYEYESTISISLDTDDHGVSIDLDLETAIKLRKHLGQEIGKARSYRKEGNFE
jgi:hypothetical protein